MYPCMYLRRYGRTPPRAVMFRHSGGASTRPRAVILRDFTLIPGTMFRNSGGVVGPPGHLDVLQFWGGR